MIATHLLGMVRQDPAYDIKYVQQNVKDRFGFYISYHKAWHALKAAREEVYGTWESSVRKLPKYMAALQKWNPGTVVEWLHLDTDRPRRKMLNYVFWAFRPCIEGFRYCRNLISIDGTHLYTKYKHKLLIAVTLDANQQVLPLAFALVDEESLESWRWFMDMLAKHLMLGDDDRICLISDRHSGIISAINFVPAFQFPRGVHRFCLRHICSNFNKKFNNIQLKDLCWRAGAEQNVCKFDRILEEIRGLNEEAFNWLQRIDKAQWTLSHDGGWRTGILTTNMSECINGVLKGSRRLPIMAIAQMTLSQTVQYFLERQTRCHRMMNNNQQWADYAFKLFESRQGEAVHHIVQKFDYNQQSASVLTIGLTGQGSRTYVVKLKHYQCSCGKWVNRGIPCSHAIQTYRHFGVNASNFVPPYYSIQAYKRRGRFEPVWGEECWDPVNFELVHNPTLRARRGPGRHVSTRRHNEMDRPQTRARQQYQARQA
ncbi:hypothetical protein Sango_2070100 [Sesamum angolense]|uniref:SWIM-type domain-containing protein n=1 Tax=Sesamum angolense TaxID=2727404 RepID=A0AAE1WB39_9LAMI|nr:hypothetical protein Sango_2070100 [Sesamum angolense]